MAIIVNVGGGSQPVSYAQGYSMNVSDEGVLRVYDEESNIIGIYAPGSWKSANREGATTGGGYDPIEVTSG